METASHAEGVFFDSHYRKQIGSMVPDTAETFAEAITPAHEPNGSPGGDVHRRVYEILTEAGVDGKNVLDYACGLGKWSMRLAQLGANVTGFDISPVAIAHARKRAELNGLTISFDNADASLLPYADDSFDIVVGIGALHHTIKYPNTAQELRRVMRPGAIAVFSEVLSHNPLIEAARSITMRDCRDAGDVSLREEQIRDWAAPFASCTIEPYSLLYMLKRVIRNRSVLSALHRADDVVLRRAPRLRRYCGECVLVLRA